MKIQLSDHFDTKRLLRFTLPSILMMIFTSIYGVVDGYFVSNYAGKAAFAAVNFSMPYLMILGELGFMVGSGGSALIGKKLGEGKKQKANEIFSLLVCGTIICGIIIAAIGFITVRPVAVLLGADTEMADIAELYGKINMIGLPAVMLQFEFHSFCVVAEKPKFSLKVTLAAGCTNMILDALLVGVFGLGVTGAAVATIMSQYIGGCVPLVYFMTKNSSTLRIQRPVWDGRAIFQTLTNGFSEFVSGISMSIVGMLYNTQLMKYAGENGVAAYGTLMYVSFIFVAIFIGFSTGSAPVFSFHYGAGDGKELKNLLKRSLCVITIMSVCMFVLGEVLAKPFSLLYVAGDEELLELTLRGFKIFSFSFLFAGITIFGSAFFTALNDGLTSALISGLRTLVFQIVSVLVLPLFYGVDGVWYSSVLVEVAAGIVTIVFWMTKRKKYGY